MLEVMAQQFAPSFLLEESAQRDLQAMGGTCTMFTTASSHILVTGPPRMLFRTEGISRIPQDLWLFTPLHMLSPKSIATLLGGFAGRPLTSSVLIRM